MSEMNLVFLRLVSAFKNRYPLELFVDGGVGHDV